MTIDIHAYIGKWPYWPVPVSTASEVVSVMDTCCIDRAVITSTRSLFVNWRDGNREALDAAAQCPNRLTAFGCIGPPELSHKLRANEFDPDQMVAVRGYRLFPQYHSYQLLYEPFVDTVCEHAVARQLPVQLPLRVLMNWGMPMLDVSSMAAVVERHPKAIWILTGLNYFQELRAGLALMRRFPTVHLETSCIQGFNAIAKIVEECGSDRLLFGTGLPMQNAAAGLRKIEHARITDLQREAILSGNAQRLLGLMD